jgi:hypothetical protein
MPVSITIIIGKIPLNEATTKIIRWMSTCNSRSSHSWSTDAWRQYRRGPTENTVPSGAFIGYVA